MKTIQYCFILVFVLIPLCVQAETKTVWVTSSGADLKAKRSASSDTIAHLSPGTKLDVVSYEKRWYKVVDPKKNNGWIYRGKVSKTRPEELDSESDAGILDELAGSEIQADAADTTRSIRGLSPETEIYAKERGTPDDARKALESVLAFQPAKKDVQAFLREEKLGEYSD